MPGCPGRQDGGHFAPRARFRVRGRMPLPGRQDAGPFVPTARFPGPAQDALLHPARMAGFLRLRRVFLCGRRMRPGSRQDAGSPRRRATDKEVRGIVGKRERRQKGGPGWPPTIATGGSRTARMAQTAGGGHGFIQMGLPWMADHVPFSGCNRLQGWGLVSLAKTGGGGRTPGEAQPSGPARSGRRSAPLLVAATAATRSG